MMVRYIIILCFCTATSSCGVDDTSDQSESGRSFICCNYWVKNTSSMSAGSWKERCSCIYESCSELTSYNDCFEGDCVYTSYDNVTQVETCDVAEPEPECVEPAGKCSGSSIKFCEDGFWSEPFPCSDACAHYGYDNGGYCDYSDSEGTDSCFCYQ